LQRCINSNHMDIVVVVSVWEDKNGTDEILSSQGLCHVRHPPESIKIICQEGLVCIYNVYCKVLQYHISIFPVQIPTL
jgi:hypothetical protein